MPKILLVDDEIDLTDYLKEYFQMKGFSVLACPSAEEALTILRDEKPELAVIDMLLAGKLDGVDILREAKKAGFPTKMVMLTGCDDVPKEREALKIGVSRYLRKPVTVKELHAVINEVLNDK